MDEKIITKVAFLLLMAVNTCWARGCTGGLDASGPKEVDANSVEAILKQLKQKTAELKSYQSQIEYSFRQPLLESETKRRGVLYYKKEADRSRLRINFQTLKQDDEEEQKYDGIEKIEDDGTVVHTERAVEIMKEMLGYDCSRIRLEDNEEKAKELGFLYRQFAAKYQK